MAFIVSDHNKEYTLTNLQSEVFSHRQDAIHTPKAAISDEPITCQIVQPRLFIESGFGRFLSNSPVTFLREMYYVADRSIPLIRQAKDILAVFDGEKPMEIRVVCARYLQESNLYNISLSDMSTIANILCRHPDVFHPVMLKTGRKTSLGTDYWINSIRIDKNAIARLPSNYGSIYWKLRDRDVRILPYSKLNTQQHNVRQIVESIVDHYDECTTENIADDLLYLYKKASACPSADPSAYYAAKVFLTISNIESIVIDKRNEFMY